VKEVIFMPRGIKRDIDFDAELKELEQKISKHKAQIANLENRKKSIMALQRNSETDKLMKFLIDSNMSVDDAIGRLTGA